ncbi:MAG: nucleotidyltransferase domain-containing protein [Desulfosarcina sp.]|nr:nucleotidyltransferase domain-containing protein [Desulfobacterales bacterium]
MNDGLKDRHRQALIDILAAHRGVEKAVLFGSRAMGTFTPESDVDIVLFGDTLSLTDQAKLAAVMDGLSIPQRVDLLRHKMIRNKKLHEHIKKHGVVWFERGKNSGGRNSAGASAQ